MATADIQLRSARVRQLLITIRELEAQEQLVLIQELAKLVHQQVRHSPSRRKITEFKGIGKRAWQGVDINEYVRLERKSWR
ncbi:MAG: hypothetical protein AAB217_24435 [Chloroflexota bacterium]